MTLCFTEIGSSFFVGAFVPAKIIARKMKMQQLVMIFINKEFVLKIEKPGKNLLGNINKWFKLVPAGKVVKLRFLS